VGEAGCTGEKSGLAPASGTEQEAGEPFGLEALNPRRDRVATAGSEQTGPRNLGDGKPRRDLEEGGGALTDIRLGMGIAGMAEEPMLFLGEHERLDRPPGMRPLGRTIRKQPCHLTQLYTLYFSTCISRRVRNI
jgi:hypothetical protein